METSTCVIDAPALVEHIHEIKSWIHHGHLRLAVPLSTLEGVRQLCHKQKLEQESKRPAPPRPRSVGRPARKEYPAFDINPRVTLEFLDRLQDEEEKIPEVIFQQLAEEYSPWKGVEVATEKKEFKEERPTTFAQAVALRLNGTNGLPQTSDAVKRPAKAKLVARASGADTSPWKMNKKAPKVWVGAIPEPLRPLLSYTLWRLYEHTIVRSGRNPLILITNDSIICNIARTLTITVKNILEIRQLIAKKSIGDIDRNSFGDLERVFGMREPKATSLQTSDDGLLESSNDEQKSEVEKQSVEITLDSNHNRAFAVKDAEAGPSEINDDISKKDELPILSQDQKSVRDWLINASSSVPTMNVDDPNQITSNCIDDGKTTDTLRRVNPAPTPPGKETIETVEQIIPPTSERTASEDSARSVKAELTDNDITASGAETSGGSDQEKTVDTPTPKMMSNAVPVSAHLSPERTTVFSREVLSQNRLYKSQSNASSDSTPCSPRLSSGSNSFSTAEAQEPEDSDEEVVVFNPRAKRWSSPPKPVIEVPQPKSPAKGLTTRTLAPGFESPPRKESPNLAPVTPSPSGQAGNSKSPRDQVHQKQASGELSPRSQARRDQARSGQGPRKRSPRNGSPRTQAQRNQAELNQAQKNRAPPAIIDPDFFGRSQVMKIHPKDQNAPVRYFQRGSPRRGPKAHEPEVDYVLSSGAPREATRGKGKLWIPT